MIVGDNHAVGIDDEARAERLHALRTRALLLLQKFVEKIVERRVGRNARNGHVARLKNLRGGNVDNGGRQPLGEIGETLGRGAREGRNGGKRGEDGKEERRKESTAKAKIKMPRLSLAVRRCHLFTLPWAATRRTSGVGFYCEFDYGRNEAQILTAHQPDDENAERKGNEAARSQRLIGLGRYGGKCPPHRPRKGGVKRAFQGNGKAERGQKLNQSGCPSQRQRRPLSLPK